VVTALRKWDPLGPETLADPGPGWLGLLRDEPVHLYDRFDPPFYTLSRHADVLAALRDIETFSSEFGQGPRFTVAGGLLADPPEHTRFRKLVQRAFTPSQIESLRPRIDSIAHALLDEHSGERLELHDAYACPLPVIVIAELLGVPPEDRVDFKRWSDVMVEAMGLEDPSPLAEDMLALARYLERAIAERRDAPKPGDDLITRLVQESEEAEGISDRQILGVVSQLLVGGNETTTSLITNAVWRLLERPERWEQLRADPSLLAELLEESLRFDPPVLGLFRTTTRDVELHGVCIPKDSKVMLCYAAANRDPEAFEKPDDFRLDRSPEELRRHLSFGHGVHFCLGAALARLEASLALEILMERKPKLSLEGPGKRIPPFFLWGRQQLPLRVG